ncbi:hypothetical protein BGZ58_009536 [Dissophora ornata]|nr:hypothetical protein BGZ58_009536 [Dissophora ornata]
MANFEDPWAKRHAWRNQTLFTRSARIRTMFPGLGIATVAFAAYLGYEYVTAPKADAHHDTTDRFGRHKGDLQATELIETRYGVNLKGQI